MVEVPQNGGYLIAAYVVAPVILGGYLMSLRVRVKRLRAESSKLKAES
jgi:CcmD family protein